MLAWGPAPSSKCNRPDLNWEKSRSDRSDSRKASASSSVLSLGTRRFISLDLLGMHITSADGPNKASPVPGSKGESDEHRPASGCAAEGHKSRLVGGLSWSRSDLRIPPQARLDLRC